MRVPDRLKTGEPSAILLLLLLALVCRTGYTLRELPPLLFEGTYNVGTRSCHFCLVALEIMNSNLSVKFLDVQATRNDPAIVDQTSAHDILNAGGALKHLLWSCYRSPALTTGKQRDGETCSASWALAFMAYCGTMLVISSLQLRVIMSLVSLTNLPHVSVLSSLPRDPSLQLQI